MIDAAALSQVVGEHARSDHSDSLRNEVSDQGGEGYWIKKQVGDGE